VTYFVIQLKRWYDYENILTGTYLRRV